jgi:hypothetical protein
MLVACCHMPCACCVAPGAAAAAAAAEAVDVLQAHACSG